MFISTKEFVKGFQEAFGENTSLPLVFSYSDQPVADTPKVMGCFFKALPDARRGIPVSLHEGNMTCGGGKFYTGFIDMPPHVPVFVAEKEKYKKSAEMMRECLAALGVQRTTKAYLNFVRVDQAETFEGMEGLLFFATPDVLSGLATWAYYDNNDADAVSAPFGSGCCSTIQMAVKENSLGGQRTFIGLFDLSVRPHVGENELGFVIPRTRFQTMQHTLRECSLFGAKAWPKVRARITGED